MISSPLRFSSSSSKLTSSIITTEPKKPTIAIETTTSTKPTRLELVGLNAGQWPTQARDEQRWTELNARNKAPITFAVAQHNKQVNFSNLKLEHQNANIINRHHSILILLIILFSNSHFAVHLSQAAIGECNFEKYSTGCYSQANFICDRDTNLCKCHPDSPILIEQRFCYKRAKFNEICQYNDQCDNANGLYCSYSDTKLVNQTGQSSNESPRCRIIDSSNASRHYQKLEQDLLQQQQHLSNSKYTNNGKKINPTDLKSHHANNHHVNHNNSPPTGLISPRLLLLLLFALILGLSIALLLIKFQCYRVEQSFQQYDDRISINSELDVPPPYEIAIRMKL